MSEHTTETRPMCVCEHQSHFPDGTYRSHLYGRSEATYKVRTVFGTFDFCSACVTAHAYGAEQIERMR